MHLSASRSAVMILLAAGLGLGAQTTPAPKAPAARAPKVRAQREKAVPKDQLVDINGASKEALMKLPGISDALADKIIAGRPYRTKAHLVTHDILPQGVYESIKHRIVAKQKPAKP